MCLAYTAFASNTSAWDAHASTDSKENTDSLALPSYRITSHQLHTTKNVCSLPSKHLDCKVKLSFSPFHSQVPLVPQGACLRKAVEADATPGGGRAIGRLGSSRAASGLGWYLEGTCCVRTGSTRAVPPWCHRCVGGGTPHLAPRRKEGPRRRSASVHRFTWTFEGSRSRASGHERALHDQHA